MCVCVCVCVCVCIRVFFGSQCFSIFGYRTAIPLDSTIG